MLAYVKLIQGHSTNHCTRWRFYLATLLLAVSLFALSRELHSLQSTSPVDPGESISPVESRLENLEKDIDRVERVASLYDSALSTQTAIFSLIVAGLLSLAGFFTWVSLDSKMEQVKTQISKELTLVQKRSITTERELKEFRHRSFGVNSNLYQLVSELYEGQKNLPKAFVFALTSATERYRYDLGSSSGDVSSATDASIKKALDLLNQCLSPKEIFEKLRADEPSIRMALAILESDSSDSNEVGRNAAAHLRVSLKSLLTPDLEEPPPASGS